MAQSSQEIYTSIGTQDSVLDDIKVNKPFDLSDVNPKAFADQARRLKQDFDGDKKSPSSVVTVDYDAEVIKDEKLLGKTLKTRKTAEPEAKAKEWRHLTKHRIVTSQAKGYINTSGDEVKPYTINVTTTCAPNAMGSSQSDENFFFPNKQIHVKRYKDAMRLIYERCLYAQIRSNTQVLIIPPLGMGLYLNTLDPKQQALAIKANYEALREAIEKTQNMGMLREIICVMPDKKKDSNARVDLKKLGNAIATEIGTHSRVMVNKPVRGNSEISFNTWNEANLFVKELDKNGIQYKLDNNNNILRKGKYYIVETHLETLAAHFTNSSSLEDAKIIPTSPPQSTPETNNPYFGSAKEIFDGYQGGIPVTLARLDMLDTAAQLAKDYTVGVINAGSDRTIGGAYEKIEDHKLPAAEETLGQATDFVFRQASDVNTQTKYICKPFPQYLNCPSNLHQNTLSNQPPSSISSPPPNPRPLDDTKSKSPNEDNVQGSSVVEGLLTTEIKQKIAAKGNVIIQSREEGGVIDVFFQNSADRDKLIGLLGKLDIYYSEDLDSRADSKTRNYWAISFHSSNLDNIMSYLKSSPLLDDAELQTSPSSQNISVSAGLFGFFSSPKLPANTQQPENTYRKTLFYVFLGLTYGGASTAPAVSLHLTGNLKNTPLLGGHISNPGVGAVLGVGTLMILLAITFLAIKLHNRKSVERDPSQNIRTLPTKT